MTTEANIELLRAGLGGAADRVEFVDARGWYDAPGRTLAAYNSYVNTHSPAHRRIRVIGEPVWHGRDERQEAEWTRYEAMLNVATKIGSWGGRGRFTTWLHIVSVNSARTTYRRLKNLATPTDFEDGAHDRPDPRTTSVIAGTRLDLLEAMDTIEQDHPQYVEPLLLRDVYGLPYDEIARLVDAPLGTVKAQIHHGRKLARPLLRGEG